VPLVRRVRRAGAWEGFVAWVHRLAGYLVTKQALAHELLEYVDRDSPLFQGCRGLMLQAGEPLLARAQQAEVVGRTPTSGRSSS